MSYKILVVDDDSSINDMIRKFLSKNDYDVSSAYSGSEAMLMLEKQKYDLLLLDLMLPGLSGEQVLKNVMDSKKIPVIGISAKDDTASKVNLLKSGADDYITKPFDNDELLARIEVVLRRTYESDKSAERILHFGDLSLDIKTMTVLLKDTPVGLTKNEFAILQLLMEHPKQVFTKDMIYEQLWGETLDGTENALNVHISNIRKKLSAVDSEKAYIKTVWGIGFKMAEN